MASIDLNNNRLEALDDPKLIAQITVSPSHLVHYMSCMDKHEGQQLYKKKKDNGRKEAVKLFLGIVRSKAGQKDWWRDLIGALRHTDIGLGEAADTLTTACGEEPVTASGASGSGSGDTFNTHIYAAGNVHTQMGNHNVAQTGSGNAAHIGTGSSGQGGQSDDEVEIIVGSQSDDDGGPDADLNQRRNQHQTRAAFTSPRHYTSNIKGDVMSEQTTVKSRHTNQARHGNQTTPKRLATAQRSSGASIGACRPTSGSAVVSDATHLKTVAPSGVAWRSADMQRSSPGSASDVTHLKTVASPAESFQLDLQQTTPKRVASLNRGMALPTEVSEDYPRRLSDRSLGSSMMSQSESTATHSRRAGDGTEGRPSGMQTYSSLLAGNSREPLRVPPVQHAPGFVEERKSMYCSGCCKGVCHLRDVRVYLGTNFVNPSRDFRDLVSFREHHNLESRQRKVQKIYCKACGQDWGNTARGHPCFKIKNFKVDIGDSQTKVFKSWTDLKNWFNLEILPLEIRR